MADHVRRGSIIHATTRPWAVLILALAAMLVALAVPAKANAQEGYVWLQVDRLDFDGRADVEQQRRSPLYDAAVSYATSDYSITKTYTGGDDGSANSPEKGETATAVATFQTVPDTVYPDWPVKLDLSLGFSNRRIVNYTGGAVETSAMAFFCLPDAGPLGGSGGLPDFKDSSGTSWFVSGPENGFATVEQRITSQIGAGEKGDRIGLCTRQSFGGITVATLYVYEWLPLASRTGGVTQPPREVFDVPRDENGDYIDSGVRVSDIGGDVQIRHGDDQLGWEFLNPGDIIYVGDVVYTADDSECILSLSDLTTFKMKPQTAIWMNTESEEQSSLALLGGKVLANVKKMINTGSMSVEMSQAVAGIKGTIFVLESDDESSWLRVLEGEVELTGTTEGVVLVSAGQQVLATNGTLGPSSQFSIGEELNAWDEPTRSQTRADIEERTGTVVDDGVADSPVTDDAALTNDAPLADDGANSGGSPVFAIVGALLALGLAGAWLLRRRRTGDPSASGTPRT